MKTMKRILSRFTPIDYLLMVVALLSLVSLFLPRAYYYILDYSNLHTYTIAKYYIFNFNDYGKGHLPSTARNYLSKNDFPLPNTPEHFLARLGIVVALAAIGYRLAYKYTRGEIDPIRAIITSLIAVGGLYATIMAAFRLMYNYELYAYRKVQPNFNDRRGVGPGAVLAIFALIIALGIFLIDVAQISNYLSMRIFQGIITIIIILILNFILFRSMPGNPILQRLMESRNAQKTKNITDIIQALMHMRGLDKPKRIQFVQYIRNMLIFRFGYAVRVEGGGRVRDILKFRLINTIILMGTSNTLSLLIGILLGVISARYRKTATDAFLLFSSLFLYSVPAFRLGLLLLYVFSFQLDRFPIGGYVEPGAHGAKFVMSYIHHMILPLITLTIISYGGMLLITRSTLIDVFTEDYIKTARAKGLDERDILYKHALRNAMLPLVTIIALSYAYIVSGAIITETLFNRPGVGRVMYDAYVMRDYPVLEAAFYIIAILVVAANIIADILYTYLDPRVRL